MRYIEHVWYYGECAIFKEWDIFKRMLVEILWYFERDIFEIMINIWDRERYWREWYILEKCDILEIWYIWDSVRYFCVSKIYLIVRYIWGNVEFEIVKYVWEHNVYYGEWHIFESVRYIWDSDRYIRDSER